MTGSAPYSSWIETDLDAISHNVRVLREIAGPGTEVMAVLKADAYGHGAQLVAPAALANGANSLALATLAEAARLRNTGINAPILLLGYTPPEQVRAAVALDLAITLFDPDVARALSSAAEESGRPARAHLKIDTGMSRLGLLPGDVLPFVRWVTSLPGLKLEGVYTHLATADGPWDSAGAGDQTSATIASLQEPASFSMRNLAQLQLQRFDEVLDQLQGARLCPPRIHTANSATLLRLHQPRGRHNLVRPGLAMYGLMPFVPLHGDSVPSLRPALSWHTRVARVVELPPNTAISYGATYLTTGQQRIVTLPVGYADGLRRSPPWRAVLIRGQRAPIVGRVCMDYVMCDVTAINGVRTGDRATLLGCQGEECISADEVATWLETSVYEVLTSIGGRVGRIAVGSS